MFEAAAVKFCKSVGEGSLLPAPSIDTAARCLPYTVVVKKNRKWYSWQSPTYEPSPFTLAQLLKEDDQIKKVGMTSRSLLSYNKIHRLSVHGKLGAQIKSVLDVELEGSDAVDVESKFGNIMKTEADTTQLMTYVANRHMDLNHAFIKQVRENPRRVLAVITGNCYLKSGGSVTAKNSVKAKEELSETTVPLVPKASEEGDVDDENDKSITLPAGTNIAYNVCELLVAADGRLTLCIDKQTNGGFMAEGDSVDGAAGTTLYPPEPEIKESLGAILSLEDAEREKLRSSVLRMCKYPADIDTCLVLLKEAHKLATAEECITIIKTTNVPVLNAKFLCPRDVWAPVLQLAGFQFMEEEVVNYPSRGSGVLASVLFIYKGLVEVTDEALTSLADVTPEYAKQIIFLLTQTIQGRCVRTDDANLQPVYACANPAQSFLADLAFSVNAQGDILPPAGEMRELQGAVRAIYGLFWEKDFGKCEKEWGCAIL